MTNTQPQGQSATDYPPASLLAALDRLAAAHFREITTATDAVLVPSPEREEEHRAAQEEWADAYRAALALAGPRMKQPRTV
jgi:hypothetical protein